MLRKTSNLIDFSIRARDGELGAVSDLLFEDDSWCVRWLVVDTGSWLSGRKVLLPASELRQPDQLDQTIPVNLTKEQVKSSPDIDTDKPVTRQMEGLVYDHYGWPTYWASGGVYVPVGGYPAAPPVAPRTTEEEVLNRAARRSGDPHLRSVNEVTGYYIQGSDDDIGHVEDFLVDSNSWMVRYIIVDTSNWWVGKQVLIAPDWIDSIDWNDGTVLVGRTRQEIKNAPEYDPSRPVERDYEFGLYRHYRAPHYWT